MGSMDMSRGHFLRLATAAFAAAALPRFAEAGSEVKKVAPLGVDLAKAFSAKLAVYDVSTRKYTTSTLEKVLAEKNNVVLFSMGYECPHSEALMMPVREMGRSLPKDSAIVVLINAGEVNSNKFISPYKDLPGLTICSDPLMEALSPLMLDRASVYHLLKRNGQGKLEIVPVVAPSDVAGEAKPWRSATKESYVELGNLIGGKPLADRVAATYPQWNGPRRFGCALVPEGSEE